MLIYIHGFNSSARSFKAALVRGRMVARESGSEFACPDLDHRPTRAIAQLEALLAGEKSASVALIGSSLGGYYATYLAEQRGLRAALINPAVRPYEGLRAYLGPQRNLHTGMQYEFTEQHLAELRALETARITPEHYLLLMTTGDEVLDYRIAAAKYNGCEQVFVEGGDHGFSGFVDYVDRVLAFCGGK
jgi:predicted esterase YcpF (UPF0227 family)